MELKEGDYVICIKTNEIKEIIKISNYGVKFKGDSPTSTATPKSDIKIIECTDSNFEKMESPQLYWEFLHFTESTNQKDINLTQFISYLKTHKKRYLINQLINNLSKP